MQKLPRFIPCLAALLAASWIAGAAEDFGSAEPFKSGDTVCFVGDSITHGGTYHSIVTLFYATRFPDRELRTFNCGIGGDRASGIVSDEKFRLNVDILGHKPTVATIMLGMNDIGHTDYRTPGKDAADVETKRRRSLEVYNASMPQLIGALEKSGARIILITPSIYDETTKLASANKDAGLGANGALGKCAEQVHAWARQKGAGVVNFYEVMNAINTREQAKDPAFTIVGPDRVHPGPLGHFVMAYAFFKAQRMPETVATIGVDARSGKAAGEQNCTISKIKAEPAGISFDCTEKSLPFVAPDDARAALALVPFTKELNQEKLVVSGLAKGNYELKIDERPVGDYSADELRTGVNLAENARTPQFEQSAAATKISQERTALGSQLRSLASQLYGMSKSKLDVSDAAAVEKSLTARLEASQKDGKPADPRLKAALDAFQKREELARDYDQLATKLRETCQPKSHHFALTRK